MIFMYSLEYSYSEPPEHPKMFLFPKMANMVFLIFDSSKEFPFSKLKDKKKQFGPHTKSLEGCKIMALNSSCVWKALEG